MPVLLAYLWINAGLYLLFAAWMTVSPWRTAAAIGYADLTASGRSEYLVIYGGLQVGLAAFFAVCAMRESLQTAGLLFALCLYTAIALYRVVTVIRFWPVSTVTLTVAALELMLWLAALLLFLRSGR